MATVPQEIAQAGAIDPQRIRQDFPIFRREVHGKRLVYLDSAATSQKPDSVLGAVSDYYRNSNANVHRGVYLLAEEATELYEDARSTVAGFIGSAGVEEVIFTRNASEAINLVSYAWGRKNVQPGDTILITPMEHHSNFVPWQILAEDRRATVAFAELTPDGQLDLDSVDRLLSTGNVKILAVAYVSNVLGTINPIPDIARRAHAAGALVLVDAAQAAPHMPLDVQALGADFVAFTGHKMLAPMGIGVLWGRQDILEQMPPFLAGGEMIRRVSEDGTTWNDLPWKFEAGTPNVGGAIGLSEAIHYLRTLGMSNVRLHERDVASYALERLSAMPDVTCYGPADPNLRGGVVAFNVDGIHPHDLASIVDSQGGVCIRAGHHCAQPLMKRIGVGSTSRASFYIYNDRSEVDVLCDAIGSARTIMDRETSPA
jgi:cysteine desulfurase/selenocysteine lyase